MFSNFGGDILWDLQMSYQNEEWVSFRASKKTLDRKYDCQKQQVVALRVS